MRNFHKLVWILGITLLAPEMITSVAAHAEVAIADREVVVGVHDAYIPSKFESDPYVVVSGLFPNGCYRWKDAAVTHDPTGLVHEVRVTASVHGGMCIMVLIPFTHEVQLGKLRSGSHTIRFVSGDGTYLEKQLRID